MKHLVYLCGMALWLLAFPTHAQFPDYIGVSQDDYANALLFLKQHKQDIEEAFPDSVERPVAVSCLFPEFLRYSMTHNMLETAMLEALYIKKGTEGADFSIGRFQMKPSFIEKLEAHVSKDSVLQWYGGIFAYDSERPHHQRKERLERLKDWHWQLRYYQCFFDLTLSKIPLDERQTERQIQLSSVSYNKNFELSAIQWAAGVDERYFPYGKKYPGEQVSYAQVALDFYHQYYSTIFH